MRSVLSILSAVAAFLVLTLATASADSHCYVRACPATHPHYTGDADGVASCSSGGSAPDYLSHTAGRCPAGFTLAPGSGLCRRDSCGGGSCSYRRMCDAYPGHPIFGGGSGSTGTCHSIPNWLGHRSHVRAECPRGMTLVAGTDVCHSCISAPMARADLALVDGWLRRTSSSARVTTVRRGQPYWACFTVRNIGTAASGTFRVTGGGLGVPTTPSQNHSSLGAAASRTGCLYYPTTPSAGSYRLGLNAASTSGLIEPIANNSITIPVTVVP